jgi:hypothetical protein
MKAPVVSGRGGQAAVQFVQKHLNIKLVVSGAMFKGFQISYLAFITFESMTGKDLHGNGMLPDDIADNHIFGDHSRPHEWVKKGTPKRPRIEFISGS